MPVAGPSRAARPLDGWTPPDVVAFDVIETLVSLEPLRTRLVADGLPAQALEWWFAQVLRDGFSLAVVDRFEPFSRVAAAALSSISARLGVTRDKDWPADVLRAMSTLPLHEDVASALRLAHGSGARVFAVTNGSAEVTRTILTRHGVGGDVERVVSIDEVRRWKPRPEPYHQVARVAGVAPTRVALVAVHAWDVYGAAAAGLRTGWCSRLEKELAPWVEPDVTGASLVEVVAAVTGAEGPP